MLDVVDMKQIEDYLYAFRAPVVPNITPARHIVERYTSTLGPSVTPEALKAAVDILDAYIIGQIGHFQVSTTAVGNPTKLIALVSLREPDLNSTDTSAGPLGVY